jgi:hypothetical protein
MTSNITPVTWTGAPTATITLTNSANKVVILARIGMQYDAADQCVNFMYRFVGGTLIADLSNSAFYGSSFHGTSAASGLWKDVSITWTDSPGTTGPVTYTWYTRSESGGLIYPDHGNSTNSIILMEVKV